MCMGGCACVGGTRMPPRLEPMRAHHVTHHVTHYVIAGWEDDYIDDTMDAENYESSFDEWGTS